MLHFRISGRGASRCESIWQHQDLSIYYAKLIHMNIMILSLGHQERHQDANVRQDLISYIQILSLM